MGSSQLAAELGDRQKSPTLNVGSFGRTSSVAVALMAANPRTHTVSLAAQADVKLLYLIRIAGDRRE
jgi:hypothetical protein